MKQSFTLTLDKKNLEQVNVERRARDISRSRTVNEALSFYFQYQDYIELLEKIDKEREKMNITVKAYTQKII